MFEQETSGRKGIKSLKDSSARFSSDLQIVYSPANLQKAPRKSTF
jgi:hypothetical protein